jgi:hypothetical protein
MTHLLVKLRSIRLWRSVFLPLNTVPILPRVTDSYTKSTTLTDNLVEDMHALLTIQSQYGMTHLHTKLMSNRLRRSELPLHNMPTQPHGNRYINI